MISYNIAMSAHAAEEAPESSPPGAAGRPTPPSAPVAEPRELPATDTPGGDESVFEWTAHPAREQPWLALVVIAAIVALVLFIVGPAGGATWSMFCAAVLVLSLHRFFFASYYLIDRDGARARTVGGARRIAWGEVRRADVGENAVWLSRQSQRTRFGERGVMLLFGRRRDAVLRRLVAHLSADVRRAAGLHDAGANESQR